MTVDRSKRERAVAGFAQLLELPPIHRLTQRGRDAQTATYTLELADGRRVRIGTIKTLWSQTEFYKVIAVAIGTVPYGVEQRDWRKGIRAMINFGTDVIEAPGEGFEDSVADWLGRYAGQASSDAGAAATGSPFIEDGQLHVNASDLARYIRREYTEQVKLTELRQALADLGFERRSVNYVRGSGNNAHRTSASYYRAPLSVIGGAE